MRAVIQRVTEASVTIDQTTRGAIQAGLLVLLGVEDADTQMMWSGWPKRLPGCASSVTKKAR